MSRLTATLLAVFLLAGSLASQTARGVVFFDTDGNGRFEEVDRPAPGVAVSNGVEVVLTDANGRYEIPVGEEATLFVIQPEGAAVPLDENNVPQFFHSHKPDGSPALAFPGVAPTGALPPSIDFPLTKIDAPERFRVAFLGDTQPTTLDDVRYLAFDVARELVDREYDFAVALGDVVNDNLALFEPVAEVFGKTGRPTWYVFGNHDRNYDAPDEARNDETFERVFGPDYYAFNYGGVHFVALNTVREEGDGKYRGGVDSLQLAFLRNDLVLVPEEKPVILMMHIPFRDVENLDELFAVLGDRPAALSVAGHWHINGIEFYDAERGFRGEGEHAHLIAGATCGSWQRGERDYLGVPEAPMAGGAPKGYWIAEFDGAEFSLAFKAVRRPDDYQMNVWIDDNHDWDSAYVAPDSLGADFYVNVFAGSEKTTVEARLDGGAWFVVPRVERVDPFFGRLLDLQNAEVYPTAAGGKLWGGWRSPHLWGGTFPEPLDSGAHMIELRAKDELGLDAQTKTIFYLE
jgi:hypothetical protein